MQIRYSVCKQRNGHLPYATAVHLAAERPGKRVGSQRKNEKFLLLDKNVVHATKEKHCFLIDRTSFVKIVHFTGAAESAPVLRCNLIETQQ